VITYRVVVKVILTLIGIVAALAFLWAVRDVLGLLLIAIFLAAALGRPVEFLSQRGLPRAASILVIYLAIFLAVFGVGLVMVPPVVDGVDELVRSLPGYLDEVRQSETIRQYDDRYGITARLQEQAQGLPERLVGALAALQSATVGVFSTLFQLVTILVMTFILLLDGTFFTDFFFRQLGPGREQRARMVAQNVYRAVGGYVVGAFAVAMVAGVSSFLVLLLLGVPYAVPLAVLMGFFDLIPLVGATIAGVFIAAVAAFSDFPTDVIVWGIFLIVYQQVENSVVQPFVQRRAVSLHPLLVIVAVLMGASLLGVLGALLAIPVAASVQILLKEYWHFREHPVSPTPADQTGRGIKPDSDDSGEEARRERGEAQQAGPRVHAEHGTDL
jgi:predicted PurR-regulated permease PerM